MNTVAVDTVQYNEMLFYKLDGSRWFYWPKLCLLLDKNKKSGETKTIEGLIWLYKTSAWSLEVCVWMIYTCHCVLFGMCVLFVLGCVKHCVCFSDPVPSLHSVCQ